MKKILNALFVALLAVFTFSSCSDVPAPYEILEPGSGNQDGVQPTGEGTKENPYNVVAAQQNQNGSVAWVEGYIVGTIENVYDEKGEFAGNKANFSGPFEIKTNVMIAASADETNEKNCLPVKIKNGSDLSNALNLQDHPENLKGKLLIQGKLAKGFGKAALVETTAAVFNDKEVGEEQGGQKPDPETPQGSVVFFEETFAQSQGAFTIDNKQLPEGSDHVWAWDSYNEKAYMKASAYVGSAKESESWLISPIVDLTKATKATLTFDHAINKINGDKTHDMTLWVKESKVSEWTQLTIAEYPAGTDWNFVSAGVMDLSAYKGKKMQFAFKYVSSTASCGTWEIKNVKIVGEGEKGEGGGTVEPEPEPQPSGENLLVNPGFEDWTEKLPKAWDSSYNTGEIVKETTIKHGGKNSLKQQSDDSTQKIQQEVTLVGGKKYRISYWFLDNDPKARSRYWFAVLNDNNVIKDLNSTLQQNSGYSEDNAEWQNVVIEFTAPENANKMRYEVRTYRGADAKGTGGGFIYYDDMELVEVK